MRIVDPSTDQWSRQEMKLFTMIQPVFYDVVHSNDSLSTFFYISTDNKLNKIQFNGEVCLKLTSYISTYEYIFIYYFRTKRSLKVPKYLFPTQFFLWMMRVLEETTFRFL